MRTNRQNSNSSDPGLGVAPSNFRVVVMGAAGVGKTCIVNRFLYEQFQSEYKATVEEFHQGCYDVNGVPLKLDILDTTGSYDFPAMRKLSISTGDAFILVYSLGDDASFAEVEKLRDQILDVKEDQLTPIVVVCNKTDLAGERSRAIAREVAESTASIDWGHGYVETSAKDDVNVAAIFRELLVQAKFQLSSSPKLVRPRRGSCPVTSTTPKLTLRRASGRRNTCSTS